MKSFISIILTFIFFISCNDNSIYFEEAYCIENISIIDPIDGLIENKTIVIKSNKIYQIFDSNKLILSKKNIIYNGKNKFLIPGLWDAHVHFAYEESLAESMSDLFLAYGVTSVRDTGGEIDFVNKFKQESEISPNSHPRIMVAGPLIDGEYNVYDGSSDQYPPLSIQTISEKDLINKVSLLIKKKVDFLKAYEMLTPNQFKALTSIAKENNLKLTGHVPLSMDVISASNMGLNSMEHFRNFELSVSKNHDQLLSTRKKLLKNYKKLSGGKLRSSIHSLQRMGAINSMDSVKLNQVINVLAKNQTWQIPTLFLYRTFANKTFKSDSWIEKFNSFPFEVKQKWIDKISKIDEKANKDRQGYSNWALEIVNLMNKKGVKFMAGTDTPIFFLIPGLSLHDEIALLSKGGLSNLEAIKSATYNPSKYFGMENELGSIKVGQIADLLILSKNPLDNISNTKEIEAVIKNGNYLNRKYLDSLLNKK
jgi:imidazolonepropionase-like amidohydrolase